MVWSAVSPCVYQTVQPYRVAVDSALPMGVSGTPGQLRHNWPWSREGRRDSRSKRLNLVLGRRGPRGSGEQCPRSRHTCRCSRPGRPVGWGHAVTGGRCGGPACAAGLSSGPPWAQPFQAVHVVPWPWGINIPRQGVACLDVRPQALFQGGTLRPLRSRFGSSPGSACAVLPREPSLGHCHWSSDALSSAGTASKGPSLGLARGDPALWTELSPRRGTLCPCPTPLLPHWGHPPCLLPPPWGTAAASHSCPGPSQGCANFSHLLTGRVTAPPCCCDVSLRGRPPARLDLSQRTACSPLLSDAFNCPIGMLGTPWPASCPLWD